MVFMLALFIDAGGTYHSYTPVNIGFQQFGNVLQLNPISRNVAPFDTKSTSTYRNLQQSPISKKKHPKDNICLHFSVKLH